MSMSYATSSVNAWKYFLIDSEQENGKETLFPSTQGVSTRIDGRWNIVTYLRAEPIINPYETRV